MSSTPKVDLYCIFINLCCQNNILFSLKTLQDWGIYSLADLSSSASSSRGAATASGARVIRGRGSPGYGQKESAGQGMSC